MNNVIEFDTGKARSNTPLPKLLLGANLQIAMVEKRLQLLRSKVSELGDFIPVFTQAQNDRHCLAVNNVELALAGIQETMRELNVGFTVPLGDPDGS